MSVTLKHVPLMSMLDSDLCILVGNQCADGEKVIIAPQSNMGLMVAISNVVPDC